jgi:hypothetical protein
MLVIFSTFLQTCVRGQRATNALAQGTLTTKAVIINKKNFFGNSPVSRQFAYSYQFSVQGQRYEGNSRDSDLQVGDSILIEYAPSNPAYNQVHQERDKQ